MTYHMVFTPPEQQHDMAAGHFECPTPDRMQVGIVGGNAWFLASIETVLRDSRRFKFAVAGDAICNALSALPVSEPSVLILSGNMSRGEIGQSILRIRQINRQIRVVVHLQSLKAAFIRDVMQAGAWGCFSQSDSPETMLNVLSAVDAGRISYPYIDLAALRDDPFEQLSRREYDVLRALSKGWSNTQISSRLGISENTVKYHLKLIYGKLDVPNRATAIAQFMQREGV